MSEDIHNNLTPRKELKAIRITEENIRGLAVRVELEEEDLEVGYYIVSNFGSKAIKFHHQLSPELFGSLYELKNPAARYIRQTQWFSVVTREGTEELIDRYFD